LNGFETVNVWRRDRYFGIFISELLILAGVIVCYGAYDLLGVRHHNLLALFWERSGSLFSYYLIALPLAFLGTRLTHLRAKKGFAVPSLKETYDFFSANYLRPKALCSDLRALLSCVLLFIVFIELKHLTPFIRQSLFDSFLIRQEERMFGGKLLSEIVLELIGPSHAPLLSEGYFLFYPYTAILIYLFVLQRDARLREEFLTGFILCWLLGVLLIFVLPTLGPVYISDTFFRLPSSGVQEMQLKLLRMRESVLDGRGGVHLISGFPSLHVAVTAYGTGMLFRLSKTIGALSLLVLLITLVTTLYFGWHYFLDDVGGLVLGFGAALAVTRYFRRFKIVRRISIS